MASPWGLHGGYSGPLVLLDRLMSAVVATERAEVDVAYRDRGDEQRPSWVTTEHRVRSGDLGRRQQVSWVFGLRRLLRRVGNDYDVLHLHGCYATNLAPLVARRGEPRLVVLPVLENGDLRRHHGVGRATASLVRRPLSRADVALALSDGIATDLRHAGVPAGNISALPNPANPVAFSHPEPRTAPPPGRVRLGFVGKLGALKRPHLLLEAVHLLIRDGVDASAVFVGPFRDEATESAMRGLVTSLGIGDHVEFTGYRSDVDFFLTQRMDVFVLPSIAEGMPGSLAEAMSRGLPSIVTDVGAMGTVIRDSAGGIVLDAASGHAIAAAARRIGDDPTFFSALSRNALNYATERFSPAAAAESYLGSLDAPAHRRE